MMLSRVAENLFWIGRYMERAENIARLVDAARRMAALPRETGRPLSNEWSSVLIAAGAADQLGDTIERADAGLAIQHLLFDPQNPSSVRNCIRAARENARAIRFAMTQECWEALNSGWAEMRAQKPVVGTGAGLADLIDWVKTRSALFRGAMLGTMVRDDGFSFLRMGAAIERADSTARLLDVKYHVLLESVEDVGSGADHYQWISILQAAAAQRAYLFVTKSDVTARGVAEFLILQKVFPRAILFNVQRVAETVAALETFYQQPAACHDELAGFISDIESKSIEDIFSFGLHEFLTSVIERNFHLANLLAGAYGFAPIAGEGESDGQFQSQ